jgi:sodium-dependent dicarboxylate transporter 2/3/5
LNQTEQKIGKRRLTGLIAGPVLFLFILLAPLPQAMPPQALTVAATAVLMAVWWITEALPIPATALLPIVLFPTLGVMDSKEVTSSYADHLIYLFMGGFFLAVTIEKWNLHKRIALHTILLVGISPYRIVLGFMLATAFLSMWISNTATTMMMVPIGLAVISQAASLLATDQSTVDTSVGHFNFGTALVLGIAYAASIGGVATLIGTPPNAILAGVIENTFGRSISFATWISFGLPLAIVFLLITWLYLTRFAFPIEIKSLPGGKRLIREQLNRLGPMAWEEKAVLAVFCTVALAWIIRGVVDIELFRKLHDSTIAIAGALLLFVIPSNLAKGEFLLDWATAVKIPWDIIILFGGGFALAHGFSQSGLTEWIANELTLLKTAHVIVLIFVVALGVIFLTELTSNTATATLLLPVMAAFSEAVNVHPYGLMIAVAVAASYAFMLPVATPPNAIVFASRYISIPQMAKAGFILNLIGSLLITLFVTQILPRLWHIELDHFPLF